MAGEDGGDVGEGEGVARGELDDAVLAPPLRGFVALVVIVVRWVAVRAPTLASAASERPSTASSRILVVRVVGIVSWRPAARSTPAVAGRSCTSARGLRGASSRAIWRSAMPLSTELLTDEVAHCIREAGW